MRFSQRITEGVGIAKILTSISRGVLMRSILTLLLEDAKHPDAFAGD